MADFRSLELPPITKALVCGTAVVTLPCLVGIVDPRNIFIDWSRTLSSLQLWRPLTALFFGGGGLPLVMDTFNLYRTSLALENAYLGDPAAYLWNLAVVAVTLLLVNCLPVLRLPVLFHSLLSALLYLWSRQNPTLKVSLFGLLSVPTRLYPWALIGLDLVLGGPSKAVAGLLGLLVGHGWWFLATYLPLHAPQHLRRPNPLQTPSWFRAALGVATPQRPIRVIPGGAQMPVGSSSGLSTSAPSTQRHRWGSGQKLGDK